MTFAGMKKLVKQIFGKNADLDVRRNTGGKLTMAVIKLIYSSQFYRLI
jgi:C-terminal processing protease CtpA/Prc